MFLLKSPRARHLFAFIPHSGPLKQSQMFDSDFILAAVLRFSIPGINCKNIIFEKKKESDISFD